jgi:methionyl-tRNA formyltransferase
VLARLLETPYEVVIVLTRPDAPAGRGLHATQSPVKQLAVQRDLDVFQPASLKSRDVEGRLRLAHPDLLVVVAYGLLVPASILALPGLGAVNVHASLLPRWRGAAPIQRALLAGDSRTGVSIMKMDEGLDTGPVFEQRAVVISADDDAGTLHDKLATLGGDALVHVLDELRHGGAQPRAQPEQGVTYAAKIDKRETELDWRRSAPELERAVRAFRPVPGAVARLGEERVKIWRAALADGHGAPGTVLDGRELVVACGSGALRLLELQRAGARRVSAAEFLRGRPLSVGARFA